MSVQAAEPNVPQIGCFISTGDNHWLGESLPIDSPAAIEDSMALLARLGVKCVYWRGLEEATWMETMTSRPENCRYDSAFHWFHQLYRDVHPDKLAVEAAHRHGMEIWGVGTLVDWQGPGDTPNFNDFPNGFESRLRLDHPEWVPRDRSGLLKQCGPIEFAYPEARKALVDLHMKFVRQDGYDGMTFVTYAENYGMRFQDEFGFNEPIVKEFKKRHGVDLLTQPFTRSASRFDWYNLRGEYLTQYLRELKSQLQHDGKKLGMILNPFEPRFTQPWNVPQIMLTAGHITVDLDTYVREGIVDHLMVWGYCSPQIQNKAVDDCLWLTRATPCKVAALTSSPFAPRWKPFQKKGVTIAMSLGDDASYLDRSNIPEQPLAALSSDDPVLRMRVLAQIIYGKTKATTEQVTPLLHDHNVIVRRLALSALGKLKDPAAVPSIEQGLDDEENAVRCAAALALRDNNRPESAAKMLGAVDMHGTHPLMEMVFHTMPRIKPAPREVLAEAASKHANPLVRSTAMRSLVFMTDVKLLPVFAQGLHDSDRFVRFAAAEALGNVRHSTEAVELLLQALQHEDPTVSDRAATSLAVIVAAHFPETDPLRARIVTALGELYAKLGDGCQRSDAEWGYRPVGNALLKMGAEGEQILQRFMDQKSDRQLALEAWKTLWIRQDSKTFSEVTEKENEEAFSHLPAWLRPPAAAK